MAKSVTCPKLILSKWWFSAGVINIPIAGFREFSLVKRNWRELRHDRTSN